MALRTYRHIAEVSAAHQEAPALPGCRRIEYLEMLTAPYDSLTKRERRS